MAFTHRYPVRFQDTDAAGVMYFANGLALCHAAYEDSLQAAGFELRNFFSPTASLAYPIIHASMDYRRPIHCGDWVTIVLRPQRLEVSSFEVMYRLHPEADADHILGEALTRHCCIEIPGRRRHPLPTEMEHWLERWGRDPSIVA
jgi:1,4-dihydroxy-2-naphthoyl-CoA hydrolase